MLILTYFFSLASSSSLGLYKGENLSVKSFQIFFYSYETRINSSAFSYSNPSLYTYCHEGKQCCGSGIRDPMPFWPLDPGSLMGKKSWSGNEQPGWYFRELKKLFFGLKYLNSLMWIRDGTNSDPGSGMEKVGSGINIPVPQHWRKEHLTVALLLHNLSSRTKLGRSKKHAYVQ